MSKYLDTCDLAKRKDELESLRDAVDEAREELDQHNTSKPDEIEDSLEALEEWEGERERLQAILEDAEMDFDEEAQAELAELENLESEISEWRHDETLIREDAWEDYCRQFAEDIGAIPSDVSWPCTCIDWERAARELAYDYSQVEYQGSTYYVRS